MTDKLKSGLLFLEVSQRQVAFYAKKKNTFNTDWQKPLFI